MDAKKIVIPVPLVDSIANLLIDLAIEWEWKRTMGTPEDVATMREIDIAIRGLLQADSTDVPAVLHIAEYRELLGATGLNAEITVRPEVANAM